MIKKPCRQTRMRSHTLGWNFIQAEGLTRQRSALKCYINPNQSQRIVGAGFGLYCAESRKSLKTNVTDIGFALGWIDGQCSLDVAFGAFASPAFAFSGCCPSLLMYCTISEIRRFDGSCGSFDLRSI